MCVLQDHDYVRWNRSSARALLQDSSKQSLAFNQKVCHDKLNQNTNSNCKKAKKKHTHTPHRIGIPEPEKRKKHRPARNHKRAELTRENKIKYKNDEIKIIIILFEQLRFTYHYLLGWFSIVLRVLSCILVCDQSSGRKRATE